MSVISSKLREEGATLSENKKYERSYGHEFLVETNSDNDMQPTVLIQSESSSPFAVPRLWTTYNINGDFDQTSYLQTKDVKRYQVGGGNNRLWLVTCDWGPLEKGEEKQDSNINPYLRPAKYHMEWANHTRVVDKDIDGKSLVNSVGDLFNPPPEQDDARPVLVATRNEFPLEFVIAKAVQYKNAVNTGTFYGAPPRQAKVESITSGELQQENGFPYYVVTYRIQFNHQSWDFSLVDQGTHARPAKDKKPEPTRILEGDRKGEPLGDVANLNPDGTQRDPDLDPPGLFKEPAFRVFPEISFNGLGI